MAPEGRTSLVAEIPCSDGDALWTASEDSVGSLARRHMEALAWFRPEEVLGIRVLRVPRAYPVVEIETEGHLAAIQAFLGRFRNLRLSGRSGRFHYTWIHVLMRWGRELVDELATGRPPSSLPPLISSR